MATRKGSISLVPRVGNSVGNKAVVPVSARYEKALQVLSDERLRQACRLVMQESTTTTEELEKPGQRKAEDTEKDSSSTDETGKDNKNGKPEMTVLQQLLQSYRECEAAVKVIQKEAPSDTLIPPPQSMPLVRSNTAGLARHQTKSLLNAKHPGVGLKTTTAGTGGTLLNRGNRMRGLDAKIMRGSRTSLTVPPSHFGGGVASLNTVSGPSGSTTAPSLAVSTTTTPSQADLNPPPEARQFLAMLNKDTPKERKMSQSSSESDSNAKKASSLQMASKVKNSSQRKRKAEEEVQEVETDDIEEKEEEKGAIESNMSDGKGTKKDNSPTGRCKRARSGSESSPDRRVQPRRSARTSE